MRLVAGLVALTLTGSLGSLASAEPDKPAESPRAEEPPKPAETEAAAADTSDATNTPDAPDAREATPPRVALRVVSVLPESHQALLFDKTEGLYVLAEEGGMVGDYQVVEIGDDDVVLAGDGREIVLATPGEALLGDRGEGSERAKAKPAEATRAGRKTGTQARTGARTPEDPYSSRDEVGGGERKGPINPYGEAGRAEVAEVAANSAAGGASTGTSTSTSTSTGTSTGTIGSSTGTSTGTIGSSTGTGTGEPALTPVVISRSELNASLADFGKLTGSLRGTFTAAGARLDVVAPASVFGKAGLKAGDLVTAVDGTPLRTIDDAANLYIRASSTRAANVQLTRAGKPLTLRVLVQ